jgi:hypothetical protein
VTREQRFTSLLRDLANWSWCLGLVVIALDFFALRVIGQRASLSYIFFAAAAAAALWAEKRQFGTRVSLYRLHDCLIYHPWKFLLLYFLWISVFSPFTVSPIPSLVYALNGWISLFTVGVAAQFIFCERGATGAISLLPQRLRLAFFFYSVTVSLLLLSTLVHLFLPFFPFPIVVDEQANLFLYFTLGFPFLLWDVLKQGRRLLPLWLSLVTVLLGTVTILLIGRTFYQASLAFTLVALFALFVYKRARLFRSLLIAGSLGAVVLSSILALSSFLHSNELWLRGFEYGKSLLERRMNWSVRPAVEVLQRTHYLGEGLGLTSIRGVWPRVLAEAGVVGFVLYSLFFLALLADLYRVRHAPRVVVSNVAIISLAVFLLFVSHHVENPYGAYVWVWYSIWALFASAAKKKAA